MGTIVKSWVVEQKGKGAPDHANTVHSAKERRGLTLDYNQTLKIFGRSLNLGGDAEYPLVPSTPLAIGADTHLTDFETLAAMPITIPAGYSLTLIAMEYTFSQDAQVYGYVDQGVVNVTCLATVQGGLATYVNEVLGFSTAWIDPTAAFPHVFDVKLYNMGANPLFGGIMVDAILEAVGTPPLPTIKGCHCPNCGKVQTESVTATIITCQRCGTVYHVYALGNFRETA